MPEAPRKVWSYDLGQTPVGWATCADVDDGGEEEVLYGPGPPVCVGLSGNEKWRCNRGDVVAIGDIDGDGYCEIVVGCGDGKLRARK